MPDSIMGSGGDAEGLLVLCRYRARLGDQVLAGPAIIPAGLR